MDSTSIKQTKTGEFVCDIGAGTSTKEIHGSL
jgi:hypothetical protein